MIINLVEFHLIKSTELGPRYSILSVNCVQYEVGQTEIVGPGVRGQQLGLGGHFEPRTILSELPWSEVCQGFSTGHCQSTGGTSLSILILHHQSQLLNGVSVLFGADLDQDFGDGPRGCGELTSYWSGLVVLPISKTSVELIAIKPDLGMTGGVL